jgi:vacuolar-type H+-ATPase subunit H
MNQEYNRLLKFVYFEGYADSYEDAEYLLEELNDDEFEELCENVSTGNAKRASFGGIQPRVSAAEVDRIRGRRADESPRKKQEREERESKNKQTAKQLLRRRELPSRGISSDTPSLRGGGITPSSVAVRKFNELRARAKRGEKGKTKFKRRANKIYNALSDRWKWGTPEARNEEFVIDYLISEGYTDNYDSAAIIYESMSDEWMYDILEAFKDTDYKEYYKNNHIDPHDDGGERDDAEYNDYINSRRDHRDQHNARRGVKKKRGAKVRDWTNEVKEEFRDLKPEQEQKVEKRVGELARTIQLHRARVKELDQKPFAKVRPGIRSQRKKIVSSAKKDANLLHNASNALIRTSVSRSAKKQKRIEDMKKRLRDMGEEP